MNLDSNNRISKIINNDVMLIIMHQKYNIINWLEKRETICEINIGFSNFMI